MIAELEKSEAYILDIFFCPHLDSEGCECRKPKPGLLLKAAEKYNINLSETYFIGDFESDIVAGRAAGAKTIFISNSNHSLLDRFTKKEIKVVPDAVAKDLEAAVETIILNKFSRLAVL